MEYKNIIFEKKDGLAKITLNRTDVLNALDDDGGSQTLTKTITVTNVHPAASFTYQPSNPFTSQLINFTDMSSDFDGIIVSWIWDFNDGNLSYEQNPQHSYNDPRNRN